MAPSSCAGCWRCCCRVSQPPSRSSSLSVPPGCTVAWSFIGQEWERASHSHSSPWREEADTLRPCCLCGLRTEENSIFKPEVRKWQLELRLKQKAPTALIAFVSLRKTKDGFFILIIPDILFHKVPTVLRSLLSLWGPTVQKTGLKDCGWGQGSAHFL